MELIYVYCKCFALNICIIQSEVLFEINITKINIISEQSFSNLHVGKNPKIFFHSANNKYIFNSANLVNVVVEHYSSGRI